MGLEILVLFFLGGEEKTETRHNLPISGARVRVALGIKGTLLSPLIANFPSRLLPAAFLTAARCLSFSRVLSALSVFAFEPPWPSNTGATALHIPR